jgi:hypothetical protein
MSTLAASNLKNASATNPNIVLNSDDSTTLGTAKLTTLADSAGANTSTPAEIASGRAKAWVNFNGTGTVAIRASYNVSSITDNGTGDYTVNFTTAMVDANFAIVVTTDGAFGNLNGSPPVTTTTARLLTRNSSVVATDPSYVNVAIFR